MCIDKTEALFNGPSFLNDDDIDRVFRAEGRTRGGQTDMGAEPRTEADLSAEILTNVGQAFPGAAVSFNRVLYRNTTVVYGVVVDGIAIDGGFDGGMLASVQAKWERVKAVYEERSTSRIESGFMRPVNPGPSPVTVVTERMIQAVQKAMPKLPLGKKSEELVEHLANATRKNLRANRDTAQDLRADTATELLDMSMRALKASHRRFENAKADGDARRIAESRQSILDAVGSIGRLAAQVAESTGSFAFLSPEYATQALRGASLKSPFERVREASLSRRFH